jgi:hypothetical protein
VKIVVFTSNQPRHLALLADLAGIADKVMAVQECTTIFPGEVEDFFRRSEVMQRYFSNVLEAERLVFGAPGFMPDNVSQLALKMGDLSSVSMEILAPLFNADVFIVFGASYIRGPLIDALIERNAINIHMGTSPYYRGSSCNFWAMYDSRPEYVGATIHLLSKGLDSGDMLFHAFPSQSESNPFVYGMQAVSSAHKGLCEHILNGTLFELKAMQQNKKTELRYTRNQDFTDAVAAEYLDRLPDIQQIDTAIKRRDLSLFLNPYYS